MELFQSIYFFYVISYEQSFWYNFPLFEKLNSFVPKLTMGAVDPFKGPSSASMLCLDNFRVGRNDINRYQPKIVSYII